MEVVDPNSALLSNYEVYKLLLEIKEEGKRDKRRKQFTPVGLSTIVYETAKYLDTSPCAAQSPTVIEEFCRAITPFALTKAEKLQILNLRPTSPVEIQLIVEECEERLSEEKVHQLIEIITRILPVKSGSAVEGEKGDSEG